MAADRQGRVDYGDFERLIRCNTKAIVCTHCSNLTGNVLDIARIGEIAHRHGALLIVDASQTAGTIPIDMEKMGVMCYALPGTRVLWGLRAPGGCALGPEWR